jgi:hypothetical protein
MISTIHKLVGNSYVNNKRKVYDINEMYLEKLGFEKKTAFSDQNKCIFRYHKPGNSAKGFDVIFVEEFGILSVEEFGIDLITGNTHFRNTIVGMFHIESDEDLAFIFSKNVRLKFMFEIAAKRGMKL